MQSDIGSLLIVGNQAIPHSTQLESSFWGAKSKEGEGGAAKEERRRLPPLKTSSFHHFQICKLLLVIFRVCIWNKYEQLNSIARA